MNIGSIIAIYFLFFAFSAVRRCANLWTGKKPIVEVMGVTAAR